MRTPCSVIHSLTWALVRHRFPFNQDSIPENGIYCLFQKGEYAHGGERIVRVGTHNGEGQLRPRLQQHFMAENKDRSIFRKNIGRAILARNHDPFLKYWDVDLTTRAARSKYSVSIDFVHQARTERSVSQFMRGNLSFVAFRVDARRTRLEMETKLISTIAACEECRPSSDWLGHHSPKQKIRESGLWLVNKLGGKSYTKDELKILPDLIRAYPP